MRMQRGVAKAEGNSAQGDLKSTAHHKKHETRRFRELSNTEDRKMRSSSTGRARRG